MPDNSARLQAALSERYRIERELGSGGMATVYLALDLKHERQVAIKVLREDLSASLGAGRFLREIKIAAQLQHPNILPLLDSGEADGFLYFVMPYVKGQSLRERLAREGELPVHEAVRLITEVVDALAHAHEHGVVHRDIKPDNVMLSGRHALVTDFGVAKAISEATGRSTITTLGVAIGTPAYMSPEQAAADPHVDHRSDIYSVGVMAYELLTGRPPFTGGTPQQVLAAQVTEAPDPVSKRRQAIPPALEQIVMRCLAKRPADRYQSAGELHALLEPLSTPSAGITPTQTQPVAAGAARRRRGLLIGAAVTGLLVVGAGIYGATLLGRKKPLVPVRTQITYTGRASGVRLSPDGAYVAYYEKGECAPDVPCPSKLIVQETAANGTRRVVDSSGTGFIAGWSPDGRRFLLGTAKGNRSLRSVVTVLGGEVVHGLNGKTTWTASPDSILVWDWVGSKEGKTWVKTVEASTGVASDSFSFGPAREINEILASSDGRWLLIEYQGLGIPTAPLLVVTSRQGKVVDTIPYFDGEVGWAGHSDRIYLQRFHGTQLDLLSQAITGRGRRSGDPELVTRVPSHDIYLRGTLLAYAESGPAENELWALEWPDGPNHQVTKRSVRRTTAEGGGQISWDGSHFLVFEGRGGGDSTIWSSWTIPFEKGEAVPFEGLPSRVNSMWGDMSRDGSRAVVAEWRDGKTVLTIFTNLRTGSHQELTTTFSDSGFVFLLPDDRVLWQPRSGREFVILDQNGAIQKRLPWPDSLNAWIPTISPDGAALAILSWKQSGDSTNTALYRFSLSDGGITLLGGPFSRTNGLVKIVGPWSSDGWVPLQRTDTSGQRRLIRIAPSGGKVVDDGPLPVIGDEVDFWYSANRRRASEWVTNRRSDIILLRNFDPRGN